MIFARGNALPIERRADSYGFAAALGRANAELSGDVSSPAPHTAVVRNGAGMAIASGHGCPRLGGQFANFAIADESIETHACKTAVCVRAVSMGRAIVGVSQTLVDICARNVEFTGKIITWIAFDTIGAHRAMGLGRAIDLIASALPCGAAGPSHTPGSGASGARTGTANGVGGLRVIAARSHQHCDRNQPTFARPGFRKHGLYDIEGAARRQRFPFMRFRRGDVSGDVVGLSSRPNQPGAYRMSMVRSSTSHLSFTTLLYLM